jgi:ribonuclease HI
VSGLTKLTLTTDGAASNNQHEKRREAAVGYVIQRGTETLVENGEYLGQGPEFTNNVAEYQAIKFGADKIASSWNPETVELKIQSDSELIVKQLTGQYGVNDKKMERNRAEVKEVLSGFANWEITQVSETSGNRIERADTLAAEAFE